jgi:hypothetical protein
MQIDVVESAREDHRLADLQRVKVSDEQPGVERAVQTGWGTLNGTVPDLDPHSHSQQHLNGEPDGGKDTDDRKLKADQETGHPEELKETGQGAKLGQAMTLELQSHPSGREATDRIDQKRQGAEPDGNLEWQGVQLPEHGLKRIHFWGKQGGGRLIPKTFWLLRRHDR